MAIGDFIPEFWSTRLQRHLDRARVYTQPTVINSDYEGEIKEHGDTVHIQKVGTVTIKPYTKGTPIDGPENPNGTTVPLVIDQGTYFNFGVHDVDKAQVNIPLLERLTERAGVAQAEDLDSKVAATLVAGAGIKGGTLGTAAAPITVGNAAGDDYTFYELCVEARRLLDNNKAPAAARWMVINPDIESTRLLDTAMIAAGSDAQRTGLIGHCVGFDILKTTGVPTVTGTGGANNSWAVIFGAGNYATTHASQITSMEAFRPESHFEDAIKGLNIWGTDVIEPETLGVALVDKGA